MSHSLSELKQKDSKDKRHYLLLSNDTVDNSKYMFNENLEFRKFYDYSNMYELDTDFEPVSFENTKFNYTEKEWQTLFQELIEKARNLDVEIKDIWV